MKKTFEVFINARQDSFDKEPQLYIHQHDMAEYGYALVMKTTVEIEIPDDFDIRDPMIAVLEQRRQKAMADHQALMNAIDGEIQKLRCIEHKEVA